MKRTQGYGRWLGGALAIAILIQAGCSTVTVRPAAGEDLFEAWRTSAFEGNKLSQRTLQTLRQLDLEAAYHVCAVDAHSRLHAIALGDPRPEYLFALSEICYHLGRDAEKHDSHDACAFYYLCAGYAYHYLFPSLSAGAEGKDTASAPSCFDPRFRLACDFYNAGLTKCIRAAQRFGRLDPRQELRVPTPDGDGFRLTVTHHGFTWRPEEFGPLLIADDYQVVGLANQYRGFGLGVPLICSRDGEAPAPPHAFYPRQVSFPVTAFFRFEGSLADLGARRAGRLELYNPLAIQQVEVRGQIVPLETDLTTPQAYCLANSDLREIGVVGFLRAEQVERKAGIYLFEPYQPGKIPVLMIHGLFSSPLTWMPLFNDLRGDPVLRERFQFWFYLYPTGNPYLVTAADLRESLAQLRADLDPNHTDAALDQMVLVGHSMGGLIARLLTVDSGYAFFEQVSREPLDRLNAREETKAELARIFFFQPQPFVKHVIFLATPHRGSRLSPSWPARLAVRFVRLPNRLMELAKDLAAENPALWKTGKAANLPTSVDLLAPGAPALVLLSHLPRPAGVRYHSIIGVVPSKEAWVAAVLAGNDDKKGSDGVVPYTSAHLDDADSELVVAAEHGTVHHHPLAALEVRRILLEHLEAIQAARSKVDQRTAPR